MKSEKLQKWALVAEICGGIGVIVTLILLILETQENTQVMRAATYDSIQADIAAWRLLAVSDNELAEINFLSRTEGRDALTPQQEFLAQRRTVALFHHYERAFIQWQLGNLRDSDWLRFRRFICPDYERNPYFEEILGPQIDEATTDEFTEYRRNGCNL